MSGPGPYGVRDQLLWEMGFRSYAAYLASDLWKRIRDEKLGWSPRCVACSRRSTQVHHLDYDRDTLEGRSFANLVAVCAMHHQFIERTPGGKKRHLTEANVLLKKLRRIGEGFRPVERFGKKARKFETSTPDCYYENKVRAGLLRRPE